MAKTTATSDVGQQHDAPLAPETATTNDGGVKAAAQAAAALALQNELAKPAADPTVAMPDMAGRQRVKDEQNTDASRIETQYGVAPKHYRSVLEVPTNKTEDRFVAAVPKVTAFINQALASSGSKVHLTEAEVAVNFLAEGGILLTGKDMGDGISGFGYAGIDTLVDRYQSVKQLLPPDLCHMIDTKQNIDTQTNERGQQVHSLNNLTIEQSMFANAALLANARKILVKDLTEKGRTWESLSEREQFYWTTVYYNAGEGLGRKELEKYGVDYADKSLTAAESKAQNYMSPHYNAEWRTATLALVSRGSSNVKTGIRPLPMRQMKVSAITAEYTKVYNESALPVARGDAPWKNAQPALDESAAIKTAFTEAAVDQPDSFTAYNNVIDDLDEINTTINRTSTEGKAGFVALCAAAHRPVPDWSSLSLKQMLTDLDALLAATVPQTPALQAATQTASQFRDILASSLAGFEVQTMAPAEAATAFAAALARTKAIVAGQAPLGDDLLVFSSQCTKLAAVHSAPVESSWLSHQADNLSQLYAATSILASGLGSQLQPLLQSHGLPTGDVWKLTLPQLLQLAHAVESDTGSDASQASGQLKALIPQLNPVTT